MVRGLLIPSGCSQAVQNTAKPVSLQLLISNNDQY